jgi:hypothetical protein
MGRQHLVLNRPIKIFPSVPSQITVSILLDSETLGLSQSYLC